ncbi:MAG: UvrD-helicase domain-containing protein [Anaerolineae bacterium]
MTLPSIVQQLHPSPEQEKPILSRGRDVVVTAGAGTGKTRTLVGRYICLLAEGQPLRGIVAITFTRRAAREMRSRVREVVRRYRDGSPPDGAFWDQVYDELDAARIGTIHSLCAEILQRHPVEAGIDPRFAMLEEGAMALERARAVGAALGWAADDSGAVRVFDHYPENVLRQLLTGALERSLDVEPVLPVAMDRLWDAWQPALLDPFRSFVGDPAALDAIGRLEDACASGVVSEALRAGDKLASLIRLALDTWNNLVEAVDAGDLVGATELATRLRKAVPGNAGQARNWGTSGVKDVVAILRARYDELLAPMVPAGCVPVDETMAREILPAFVSVYQHALSAYRTAKQQANALDFDDLESGTLALLRDHPEVLEEWQANVTALLVDEYQDTNARQRDLVNQLNGDRGRLFIVGDAKQSIYAFRGADVAVFRKERQRIALSGEDFDLTTTYRAHPGLVGAHNVLLAPVLGTEEDPDRPYVEPLKKPATSGRERAAPGVEPPHVELHLVPGKRDDASRDRSALALVARLASLMAQGIQIDQTDPETGVHLSRPLDYGDVAILCRATSSFGPYEDALEGAHIPYLTISGRGFYGRPEVRDLINALQALADPSDDLALVGLLRSPAFAVDDMTIYRLRSAQRELDLPSLWDLLHHLYSADGDGALADSERLYGLPESRGGLQRAIDTVNGLTPLMGRRSVADLLKAYLDATHYRAILLAAGQERAARNVDKLLDDASTSGLMSAGELVDYLSALRDVASREGEARGLARGAVQIMSIHQAKGLEFPIVVLGDATRGTSDRPALLVDKQFRVVLPPPRKALDEDATSSTASGKPVSLAYSAARRKQADREEAEGDRLLYVAATRAEELLIVSGVVGLSKAGKLQPDGMLGRLDTALHLGDYLPAVDLEGTQTHARLWDLPAAAEESVGVLCTVYEPGAALTHLQAAATGSTADVQRDVPDLRMLEALSNKGPTLDVPLRRVDLDPPQRVWRVVPRTERAHAPAWVVGQLVHRALARWSFPDSDQDFSTWSDAEARDCGLTDERERRDALLRAGRMLRRFQGTPLYLEMGSAEQRLGEIPYSLAGDGGVVESGIIDSLFRSALGWTLVEFKTDDVRSEESLNSLLDREDYVPQVRRYLKACRQLLPRSSDGKPVKVWPRLVFLDFRGSVRVVSDRWDQD